jgi:hypothetical protein
MNTVMKVAVSCFIAGAISSANTEASAITWTCSATIYLATNSQFLITEAPWTMSGGLLMDRERACKTAIQDKWLNNGYADYIWRQLVNSGQMTTVNVTQYCGVGADFVVRYGFDQRPKNWQL